MKKNTKFRLKIKTHSLPLNMVILAFTFFTAGNEGISQYNKLSHREPESCEISVTGPGYYGEQGKTYVLMKDISDPGSVIFLGRDVTLDLNGHTLNYAEGSYDHIQNYSFEDDLEGWDNSLAPGARIAGRKVHVMIGEKVLLLSAGEEVVSSFVMLPLADRSYFAFCGVAAQEMKIRIIVEDQAGKEVGRGDSLSPRLGGGIPYVHLYGLPPGKYRLRIKALTDCIVDYADIRPALDVGIGIVEEIEPGVGYEDLYRSFHGSFYDYATTKGGRIPLSGIPVVKGKGTVTIRNGIIRNATEGILSWGIQSNADDVTVIIDNVKIVTAGINTNAVDVPQAVITGCTFDVNNPFIINRHGSDNYGVDLWGKLPSEVSYSEFYGGQGCLVFKGDFSKIHHNLFVNRQTVTNHYSIMAMGDSSLIYDNRILPETGSGIEIYIHRGMEIFNNEISIEAAPPTCEYGHSDYSTTAIRIADYNAVAGTDRAAWGNKVYNNRILVRGKDYPDFEDYVPMAWAVFYSTSGGENYIFGNEVIVEDLTPGLKNETSAFYIGGRCDGGIFSNNVITSNVPAFWVATRYGPASNILISGNKIIKTASAVDDFKPVRMGWYNAVAENIEFRSNKVEGSDFMIDRTDMEHSWSVFWALTIRVVDGNSDPCENVEVSVTDSGGEEVYRQRTDKNGYVRTELAEYIAVGNSIKQYAPYTVKAGRSKRKVSLVSDTEIIMVK
ncbi:MAG TPA: hypothetical protein PLE95_01965 [Bacteroidales bacterium]|nr:hypothetical protein [Bacteroidales bacterium]